jgi:hypothetical protein
MQPSIPLRLVLVLLAMCVAPALAGVPERAGGEPWSAAASQSRQLLQLHPQRAQQIYRELAGLEIVEASLDAAAHGIQSLSQNPRMLLDAEIALNEGGTVPALGVKPVLIGVQIFEKLPAGFVLEMRNRGGHSSQPRKDGALHQFDELARFEFPIGLNATTRAVLQPATAAQPSQLATAMRALVAGSAGRAALAMLSAGTASNGTLRTTCMGTLLEGTVISALSQVVQLLSAAAPAQR